MKDRTKMTAFIMSAMMLSAFAAGCSDKGENENTNSSAAELSATGDASGEDTDVQNTPISQTSQIITDGIFSDRDISADYDSVTATITMNGSTASVDGTGASCDGSDITITDEGVYVLTGTLDDGQILVNSAGKVQLVMDNASVSCSDSAPIYVKNADKTFVTLASGTENYLSDGLSYVYEIEGNNEPDAALFSADSLTVNGTGTLNIIGNYNEGITSKDDIVITGGTINITSAGNGIKGKDYVAVCGGDINIEAGGDGLKSSNTEDASLGFVYFESGNVNITAQEDGIQAETEFISSGGSFNINAGGGSSAYTQQHGDNFGMMGGGRGGFGGQGFDYQNNSAENADPADTTPSTKGIKSGTITTINGGTFNIDSADDALHSNGYIHITGGEQSLITGNDGINADLGIDISDGRVNIQESYEGIESAAINVSGGQVELKSSDDGFNGSDGTSQGAMGSYSNGVSVNISGGTVCLDSDGDGLDSNGNMTVSGGTVIVNGPTNSGNGALDGNGEITVTGGLLIAAGSSGMAETPGSSSTQHSVFAAFDSYFDGGTLVTLCSESGDELLSFAPEKSFDSIIISTADINNGGTYTIFTGGTSSAAESYGLYEAGGYNSDGVEAGSFTAEDITSYIGSAGMGMHGGFGGGDFGGGRGGGFGGGHGGRDDIQITTDENGEIVMPEGMEIPGDREFPGGGEMELPTNANGEVEMPDMPQGGMMIEPPTGENGMPEMPGGMPGGMGGNGYPLQ